MNRHVTAGFAFSFTALALLFGGTYLAKAQDSQPAKQEVDLSGTWKCEGWNLGADFSGKPDYEIQVALTRKGNDTYLVAWKLPNGSENKGVGLYDARTDVFAAGYAIGKSPGVAVFQPNDDHTSWTCRGVFAAKVGQVAQERWSRSE